MYMGVICMGEYVSVSLPADLIKEVDEKAVGKKGYKTRPEFIKDAIRRLLEEIDKEEA